MNTFRRKELNNIAKELTVLREKLEAVYEDEYEAYNNMPKGLQNLGRGKQCVNTSAILKTILENSQQLKKTLTKLPKGKVNKIKI